MRGKVVSPAQHVRRTGITPAYAGKRGTPKGCVEHCGDHPRLCGEKRKIRLFVCEARGITPAYAGKSMKSSEKIIGRRDHPRLCGEKCLAFVLRDFRAGSPPPMRGKDDGVYRGGYSTRITPAYAGKSQFLSYIFALLQDHPRLCGEKNLAGSDADPFQGSPPPMRGKD